ncbi:MULTISPECIES: helix-turn-helix domain-containing protein [unclassified Paenibacillus]|uniref:helix-turn-helix domain-containing protein n=1 Tax=unclassified Paenibacillus TaxID=185978 RepID=UPI0030F7B3C2
MEIVGKRIKGERETLKKQDQKWTQEYVADLVGIARSTYTAYENGTKLPPVDTLNKIGDIFNCDTDYLSGRSNIRKKPEISLSFYDGSSDWTEDEFKAADEFIKEIREARQRALNKANKEK